VIGRKKFSYDLWGDTVNMASRMESSGVAGQIQVTARAYERLQNLYLFRPREPIEVKGKGTIASYLLVGRTEVTTDRETAACVSLQWPPAPPDGRSS
jgi:adenylate cyclase